ncbi:MAG TPA: DUF58 domain-containing protein [Longimicrobiales bacterium]
MPGFLPTSRLLALAAAAAPLFLLDARAALAADGLLLALALADALLAPRPPWVRIERRAPTRIALGADGDVVITARNGTRRAIHIRVTDDLPPGLARAGTDTFERVLPGGAQITIRYTVRATARGSNDIGDIHLRARGPLGLVWRQDRIPRRDPVHVRPGTLEVRRYRLLGLRGRLREPGSRVTRQRAERGSFESLREYTRGDDPRTIDWKATARRGAVMVRRYEAERSQNVLLAIDAGRLMTERVGDRERIDHALSAALLLADVAAAHGDRVGILAFADRIDAFLPPTRLPLSRIADALADVHPRLVEPNYPAAFTYLARQLRRRSLLVLFTDVIDARASAALIAHLGRSATRHLPLAIALRNPDLDAAATAAADNEAAVFHRVAAEELLQARARALAAMQRAGVLVADTRPQDAVPATVNRYLDVKRRGLL